eukprot:CAMPEP_0184392652 /NCGR_PEP_ID=MMETSP0007-20130409/29239_1 /TAXON_ID=97485 /ORGANISM="Prymnesium parvum, Strain Texoma1" /LENGTH=44 /DNA_ID= /DNA_START= /DNA_END= /DNA_ORIENTATION=
MASKVQDFPSCTATGQHVNDQAQLRMAKQRGRECPDEEVETPLH